MKRARSDLFDRPDELSDLSSFIPTGYHGSAPTGADRPRHSDLHYAAPVDCGAGDYTVCVYPELSSSEDRLTVSDESGIARSFPTAVSRLYGLLDGV